MQSSARDSGSGGFELCLTFTDTLDWRTSDHAKDRLASYADLVSWSRKAGILDEVESARHLELAGGGGAATEGVLLRAKDLRESIYRIFSAVAHGKRAARGDVEGLNGHLAGAMAKMEVKMTEEGYSLGWRAGELADKMLFPIAKSAAELLTSGQLDRVRECANEEDGCGSLFIDSSKSHSRRWCSMDSCGNKVKLRAYYQRRKGHRPAKAS